MVMDYIEGESLEDYLIDRGKLPEPKAVEIIQKIGGAVSYVHAQKLLHRDIKPANILIKPNGEPILIDFGLAREFVAGIARSMTSDRTPHYSPPEQAERRGDFQPPLDIYALAATLYTCVTGDLPPLAEIRIVRDSLIPPQQLNSGTSDGVNWAILKGMALKPEDRSSTVEEWLELLQPTSSADLSVPVDAPTTFAIVKKLLNLEEAAATHTGRKCDRNEDCFGIFSSKNSPKGKNISGRGLYILCDGMGGHAGGEIASVMTVDILRDYFDTRWGDSLPDEQTIREGIVAANEAVFKINEKNSASGSGRVETTLALVLFQEQNIAVAHVGDSRCYGITPTQGLMQLTLDHEVGQQDILHGVDPEIAYGRPDAYQLTQAIGRDRNHIAPDIRFFELQEDTLIVLASDGLTDNEFLENYWLTNVAPLLSANSNLQDGVDRLIDFANERNGHDNITAIVVRATFAIDLV
jgi:serine/threonine protein phosphatase PrpC